MICPGTFNESYYIFFRALWIVAATKSFLASASTGRVAKTEAFLVGSNSTLPPLKSVSGVRNSSSHDGVTVSTPSKSISIGVAESKPGRMALNASSPAGREMRTLPKFLSLIVCICLCLCLKEYNSKRAGHIAIAHLNSHTPRPCGYIHPAKTRAELKADLLRLHHVADNLESVTTLLWVAARDNLGKGNRQSFDIC